MSVHIRCLLSLYNSINSSYKHKFAYTAYISALKHTSFSLILKRKARLYRRQKQEKLETWQKCRKKSYSTSCSSWRFSPVMAHCFTIVYNSLKWPKRDILGTISFPLINNLLPLCSFQCFIGIIHLQTFAQGRPSWL